MSERASKPTMKNHLHSRRHGNLPLKWRIFMMFGIPVVLGVALTGFVIFQDVSSSSTKSIGSTLMAVAGTTARVIDVERLKGMTSADDLYYLELRQQLRTLSEQFNLTWLSIYRWNGRFFTHVADGEKYLGDGFCFNYPILDIPDELRAAQEGTPQLLDFYVDAFGSWTSAFYPITDRDGNVVGVIDVSRDADELSRLQDAIITRTGMMVLIIVLFMLAICFLVASKASGPLARLGNAAREIAAGRLGTRITEHSADTEIGQVIDSFNHMSEALQISQVSLERKIYELTTLNEIAHKITFASSTADILRVVLEKTVQTIGVERGSIMLFNEETECLSVAVAWGEGLESVEPRIELKSGEGIAGKVFAEQEPRLYNKIPEGVFQPYTGDVSANIDSILCIPLIVEKKAIGVMNLVNRKNLEFSDNELTLAGTLGSQVALAIEKSRLYELAITDGLTKLHVHRYFQLSLDAELRRSKRYGNTFALILFDIDHFKKFNDTYGHQTGDMVLIVVAKLLKSVLRNIDLAARYGGEEFAVILPEATAETGLLAAERIRKLIANHDFPGQDTPLKVTISLGISAFPEHSQEKMHLIRAADMALYECKRKGRNCSTIYHPGLKDQDEH